MSEEIVPEVNPLADAMTATFEELFPLVYSADWKNLEVAEQIVLRAKLEGFVAGANMLREKFDAAVWAGHSDGTVSVEIQSIRKQREGDKPGRKAKDLTPAEILAKRLSK